MFALAVRAVRYAYLLLTSPIAVMSFARVLNPSMTRLPACVSSTSRLSTGDAAPVMGILGPLAVLTNTANALSLAFV